MGNGQGQWTLDTGHWMLNVTMPAAQRTSVPCLKFSIHIHIHTPTKCDSTLTTLSVVTAEFPH